MTLLRRYWRRIHAFFSLGVKRKEEAEIQASASRQSVDIWIKKLRSGLLTGEMMVSILAARHVNHHQ